MFNLNLLELHVYHATVKPVPKLNILGRKIHAKYFPYVTATSKSWCPQSPTGLSWLKCRGEQGAICVHTVMHSGHFSLSMKESGFMHFNSFQK